MIPKVIHYCWFGGKPLPDLAKRCIASWKKYCPDYEIVCWNEENFDIHCCAYVEQAYKAKKWAFVTDYVRLYVLYNYGGIYMDTDVEVLKPLDFFLPMKAFSGFEAYDRVPTGIMASKKGHHFIGVLLGEYAGRNFTDANRKYDMTTNVRVITNTCVVRGLQLNNQKQTIDDFTLYPCEYFCPKNPHTKEIRITQNSYAIHHFDGSWLTPSQRIKERIKELLGPDITRFIQKLKSKGR
ncbi:glycosyl transferase [Desulfitobacterium hafniense]|uniref:Glycosyl transferase n=1 Tax=Desulfitobacterium hafniense TaxID=49338 RepID=A0A0W1JQB5_DESHA|nr:glycosyltransferase [Desulfitobacterium hafniense]KTE93875.1 glycosyl transferase [Desulfitobacterium hafniense]